MLEHKKSILIKDICCELNLDYKSTLLVIEEQIKITESLIKRYLIPPEVDNLISNSISFILHERS